MLAVPDQVFSLAGACPRKTPSGILTLMKRLLASRVPASDDGPNWQPALMVLVNALGPAGPENVNVVPADSPRNRFSSCRLMNQLPLDTKRSESSCMVTGALEVPLMVQLSLVSLLVKFKVPESEPDVLPAMVELAVELVNGC